jgi:hypothetical protein
MIAECNKDIFITITLGERVIMERVKTCVKTGESYSKVAKELRKQIADSPSNHGIITENNKLKPSVLGWRVYENIHDFFCILHSENW